MFRDVLATAASLTRPGEPRRMNSRRLAGLSALSLLMAGCAVGPNYKLPAALPIATPTPTAYKEAEGWVQAMPSDAVSRQDWWKVFNDPVLDDLEAQVVVSNQNLAQAEAAYREAKAVFEQQRATLFPTVNLTGTGVRELSPSGFAGIQGAIAPAAKPINIYETAIGGSWDIDVWGRIRRSIESAHATAQADAADLANATLSAQTMVAADYFQLREADEEKRIIDETVKGYAEDLRILQIQTKAGTGPLSNELSAHALLKSTQASAVDLVRTRAQWEHAIAVLVGKAPADLTIEASTWNPVVPAVPVSMPSALLQRRPDIAEAERSMKAANALIGVNEAGYFPDISVSGQYGFTSILLNQLLNPANTAWSIGGTGTEAVFNAGATEAKVRGARAAYDAAVANYRQTVLAAFQQVEDSIAALRVLESKYDLDKAASEEADRAENLINKQYQAGTIDYTTVFVAQTTALNDRRVALQAARDRLVTMIDLVGAFGGGWSATQLAQK
jgi:NodT family efflux transporter outer membrane factor (OMF) lipoprotein